MRVEDNGRRAYIGMGFLERTDSFDFSEHCHCQSIPLERYVADLCDRRGAARLHQVRITPLPLSFPTYPTPSSLPSYLTTHPTNRRWRALQNPTTPDTDSSSPHVPAGPKKDYSLKDGQTFSISIPGRTTKTNFNQSATSDLLGGGGGGGGSGSGGGGVGVPLLPPPPPGAPRRR